jgi:hypothetical protein
MLQNKSKNQGGEFLLRAPIYPPRHRSVPFMAVSFLTIVLVGYIIFQSSSIFETPDLVVSTPHDGALLQGSIIEIKGTTIPNVKVFINGFEVFSDDSGKFQISLPFTQGFHIIVIKVTNRIGNEASVVRRIVVE